MRTRLLVSVTLTFVLAAMLTAIPVAAQEAAPTRVVLPSDRTVLPIPEPQYPWPHVGRGVRLLRVGKWLGDL